MVLLKRLYSETGLFDEVKFHNGLNIIRGKYSDNGQGINGIGKSTLVRLIDFAFLSTVNAKKYFNPEKYSFLKTHGVTLEFSIGSDIYHIRRNFDDIKIAYFGKIEEDLTEYAVRELKDILWNKFFLYDQSQGYFDNNQFRNLMKFFVKDDIDHHQRTDPINFLGPNQRKPTIISINFFLLNLPNKNINEYDVNQEEIRRLREFARDLEKKIKEDTGKPVESFKSDIVKIEERIKNLQESLKEFKFLKNYKDLEDKLVELSDLISNQLKKYHFCKKRLENYQDSYKVDVEIDVKKVKHVYDEINENLSNFVNETLDRVIQFRKDIAEGRKRFLIEKEKELNGAIELILKDISQLEEKRSKLYSLLDEKEAFDSIRHTYEQLIEERALLERNLSIINKLDEIQQSIAELNIKVSESISKILTDIKQSENAIRYIRALFAEILKNAIFVDETIEGAYLDIKGTSNKKSPVDILIDIPKSDSLGKSRFKILAYDLTVFMNIIQNKRSLPHFLIHDGVFHSIEKKTIVNVLNYIYSESLIHPDFQYIFTVNEDEIEVHPDREKIIGKYQFDINEHTVAIYEDVAQKMIFKRVYQN